MDSESLRGIAIVLAFASMAAWFIVKAVWAALRGVPAKFSHTDYITSLVFGIAVFLALYMGARNPGTLDVADPAFRAPSAFPGADPAFSAAADIPALAVTGVYPVHLGFDMIEVSVVMQNDGVSVVRNPVIRCDHMASNGTLITTSEYQVYRDIAPGETARATFNAMSSSQTREVICVAG